MNNIANLRNDGANLRQDFDFARKNRQVLEFLPLLGFQFVAVGSEFVEKMIDNVGLIFFKKKSSYITTLLF